MCYMIQSTVMSGVHVCTLRPWIYSDVNRAVGISYGIPESPFQTEWARDELIFNLHASPKYKYIGNPNHTHIIFNFSMFI